MRIFELGSLKHRIVWGDCTSPEVQNALWGGQGEQAVDLFAIRLLEEARL